MSLRGGRHWEGQCVAHNIRAYTLLPRSAGDGIPFVFSCTYHLVQLSLGLVPAHAARVCGSTAILFHISCVFNKETAPV